MRRGAFAALVLCGCTGVGGVVDPKVMGEYQWWFIDVGESIDLAADGTFVRRGIGISPISPTVRGDWAVSEGRVVLHATKGQWFGRIPLDEQLAREYPAVFATRCVEGALALVDETERVDRIFGWPGMEWVRYEPRTGAR